MPTTKMNLRFINKLKEGWFLTNTKDKEVVVVCDMTRKIKPTSPGCTLSLFKPYMAELNELRYTSARYVSVRDAKFPMKAPCQEDITTLTDLFNILMEDVDLPSLTSMSQQVIIKVKTMLKAVQSKYGERVVMKNLFKGAGRFNVGRVYRVRASRGMAD